MTNMNVATDWLSYLGLKVVDRVTGFEGVVSSVSFDLYGCIQAVVTPPVSYTNQDSRWFDIVRLRVVSDVPVMHTPDFVKGYVLTGNKGCDLKTVNK